MKIKIPEKDKPFFVSAALYVVKKQKASLSSLQWEFKWASYKADRIMALLEKAAIISPDSEYSFRKVLVADLEGLKNLFNELNI